MLHERTMTASTLRQVNLAAILEMVRKHGPISRTEISEKLNISAPTVMRIVDDLVEAELICVLNEVEQSGGRPRTLIEFNGKRHSIIGIDLGRTRMYGALVNIGGEVLDEISIDHNDTGEVALEKLVDLINILLQSPQKDDTIVCGIGVGAPSITNREKGIITWAPGFQWRDYPLKAKLREQFDLPIIVDNDVNLAALGELWFGVAKNTHNLVYIMFGIGVGAGIIIDGVLYQGQNQAAGEIGYFPPDRQYLGQKYSGFGALEGLASTRFLLDRVKQNAAGKLSPEQLAVLSVQDTFDAYWRGDSWMEPILSETIDYLAMTVAAIGTLLDPEMIVIEFDSLNTIDRLIADIQKRIAGVIPVVPNIAPSHLGPRATVLGIITSTLHLVLNYQVVRKLA